MNKNHFEFNKNDLRITNRKLDELEAKLKGAQLSREPMVIISWDYFKHLQDANGDHGEKIERLQEALACERRGW